MERVAILAFLAGCGFRITTGSVVDDASPSDDATDERDGEILVDAPAPIDGMLPDQPIMNVEECEVERSGPSAVGALLGGTTVQHSGSVSCDGSQLGVGLQYDVTPVGITGHNGQILLTTIRLWCGTVARNANNQYTTSNLSVSSYTALQGSNPAACNMYMPPTALGQVMCPNGSVLVGITGHQVDTTTLYNNVSIRCASMIAATGQVSTTIVTAAMPGTGTNPAMPEETQCPASTAITSINVTSGCGQDGATAVCTATFCNDNNDQK